MTDITHLLMEMKRHFSIFHACTHYRNKQWTCSYLDFCWATSDCRENSQNTVLFKHTSSFALVLLNPSYSNVYTALILVAKKTHQTHYSEFSTQNPVGFQNKRGTLNLLIAQPLRSLLVTHCVGRFLCNIQDHPFSSAGRWM